MMRKTVDSQPGTKAANDPVNPDQDRSRPSMEEWLRSISKPIQDQNSAALMIASKMLMYHATREELSFFQDHFWSRWNYGRNAEEIELSQASRLIVTYALASLKTRANKYLAQTKKSPGRKRVMSSSTKKAVSGTHAAAKKPGKLIMFPIRRAPAWYAQATGTVAFV